MLALFEEFGRLSTSPQLAAATAEQLRPLLAALVASRVLRAPPVPAAEPPSSARQPQRARPHAGAEVAAVAEPPPSSDAARTWELTQAAVGRISPQLVLFLAEQAAAAAAAAAEAAASAPVSDGVTRADDRQPSKSLPGTEALQAPESSAQLAAAYSTAAAGPAASRAPDDEAQPWTATFADDGGGT